MKGLDAFKFEKSTQALDFSFWKSRNNFLLVLAVGIITFVAYIPSLHNGFVNWDDSANIYENFYILKISTWSDLASYFGGIFTSTVIGNYNPLSIFSFALEKLTYGLNNPGLWHLDNIVLHLICVILILRISLSLGLKIIPAAFCALLFGIQPMRVESVAWVTERKDVLYGLFFLLALYYYIKSILSTSGKHYSSIITICFILSLLAKIQAVTLPLSMLAVDYYLDRKLNLKLIYKKWHYFLLSILSGLAGIYFLRKAGMLDSSKFLPFFDRLFIGSYSYIVYVIKSVVPYEMVPWYPYPDKISWVFFASMVPALLLLSSIYYFFRKKNKVIVFGLLFFTVNIVFLLQILSAGQGFLADRFTYIAYFGLFFIYAYLFQRGLERYKEFSRIIYLAGIIVLAIFGYVNFQQNKIWENGKTLWSHVLMFYPDSYIAMRSRANYYRDHGKFNDAIEDYNKAISFDQYNPKAFYSRGLLYYKFYFESNDKKKLNLALYDFSKAILLSPRTEEFYLSRGRVYSKLNILGNALRDFDEAQRYNPADNNIYYNRSRLYIKTAQYVKAQQDIEKYLSMNPYDSDMWSNLGLVYRLNMEYEKSINAFNKAIQMNPEKLFYYNNRLMTFYEMGDIQRARSDLNFLKSNGFKDIDPKYQQLLNQGK